MNLEEAIINKKDYQFSPNFSLMELIHSDTALSAGIDNWPQSLDIAYNLQSLVINVLQPLRDRLKSPVFINSGYRCSELNSHPNIRGVVNSDHLTGSAADIHCPAMGMKYLAIFMTQILPQFNQLILEKWNINNPSYGWVHISYSRVQNKNQTLTFDGRVYSPGLPS